MIGHSDGGVTAAGVAFNDQYADPRIGAAVVISGAEAVFPGSWFSEPAPALLAIHATDDEVKGDAVLATSDATSQYAGHLHVWFGGGNNKAGQTENGFTLTFQGSGALGSIKINANQQTTTNNGGTTTANHMNGTVTCS